MNVQPSAGGKVDSMQIDVAAFTRVSNPPQGVDLVSDVPAPEVNAVASTEFPYSLRTLSLVLYSTLKPADAGVRKADIVISESEGAIVASGSEPVRFSPYIQRDPAGYTRIELALEDYHLPMPGTYMAKVSIDGRVFQSHKLDAVYLD